MRSLTVHPVKSLAGVDLDRSPVTSLGLDGDRRWAVLDPDGVPVTAREVPAMLGLRAEPTARGVRLVADDGVLDVAVPAPGSPTVATALSRIDRLTLADPAAGDWLSARLGTRVRLAHQAAGQWREIGATHGGLAGEPMALADAGPVLLVTWASLDRLRDWVAETQGEEWLDRDAAARRFRPNVVVDGEEPFAEDRWRRVRLGGVTFRLGELCDRCVMTTIDLDLLETSKEPVRTLARHRRWDGTTWFGVRLVPEDPGPGTTVAVGDEVEVVERA